MNCEAFENLMIINICGKLTYQEKSNFDQHLTECSKCASIFEQIKNQGNILNNSEPPKPDWEKSWEVIAQKSVKRKRFVFSPRNTRNTRKLFNYLNFKSIYQKYLLAAATVILIFIIGFTVGRKLFLSETEQQLVSASSISDLSLQSFAENLELILIDFLNQSDQPIPVEFAKLEKRIVSEMLVKTKLLKYIMQKRENTQLVQLLGDIEFILINLSNLRPEDSLSKKQIQHFIHEKNLKYQLKLVVNEKLTI